MVTQESPSLHLETSANYTGNYAQVIDLGPFSAPWIMDLEDRHYFLLRHRRRPFSADWPTVKDWY